MWAICSTTCRICSNKMIKRYLLPLVLAFCVAVSFCACVDDRQGVPNPAQQPSDSAADSQSQSSTSASSDQSNTSGTAAVQAEQSTEVEIADTLPLGEILRGAPDATAASGLAPLSAVTYTVPDPDNRRGLSTAKKEHSHGPTSGGKAHFTVEQFQDGFDRFGALTLDRTSREKVLYLTFDCGWEYDNLTARILDTLKEKQVPAAFFCTRDHISRQPELIARMIREGHIVGNHSDTHPSFPSISRTQMVKEIADTENYLREHFGYCAKFFRFPAGEYSESALDVVRQMGYRSVFWSVAYNDWNVEQQQGADKAKKTVLDRLHPGAVILLHAVSRDNAEALGAIIDAARAEGYAFVPLTHYRPPAA